MNTYSLTPDQVNTIDRLSGESLRAVVRATGRELEMRGWGGGETNEDYQTLLDTHDYASDRMERS